MNFSRLLFYFATVVIGPTLSLFLSQSAPDTQVEPNYNEVWSTPINLSINREGRTIFPFLLADDLGGLHVFWEEHLEDSVGSEIVVDYAYWDGVVWSERRRQRSLSPG